MGADEGEPRVGFWRRWGRRLSHGWEALELVEFVVTVLRVLALPFRLLAKVLNAL